MFSNITIFKMLKILMLNYKKFIFFIIFYFLLGTSPSEANRVKKLFNEIIEGTSCVMAIKVILPSMTIGQSWLGKIRII